MSNKTRYVDAKSILDWEAVQRKGGACPCTISGVPVECIIGPGTYELVEDHWKLIKK